MNTVTAKRVELLKHITANRETHRDTFMKAQEVYRQKMIEELDRMLMDARAGHRIRRIFVLPEPEDHTKDYDREIKMLELSVNDEIELTAQDFNRYVMDQWEWTAAFNATTASYVNSQ